MWITDSVSRKKARFARSKRPLDTHLRVNYLKKKKRGMHLCLCVCPASAIRFA
jgi:hypothetical protein